MADQVGIAADRRREVAVALRAQAEVAEVARGVARLLERAQDQRRVGRAVDLARGLLHELAGLLGGHVLGRGRRGSPERRQLVQQALHARRVGRLVHAEHARRACASRAGPRPPRWPRSSGTRSARATRCSRSPPRARRARRARSRTRARSTRPPARRAPRASRPAPAPPGAPPPARSDRARRPRTARPPPGYESRTSDRMSDRWNAVRRTCAPSNSSSTVTAIRSCPGTSEHAPLDSASGSIGSTSPGTYTDVPRRNASRSTAEPGRHERRHVRDVHPHAHGAVVELLGRDRVVEVARRRRVDRERRQVAQIAPALRRTATPPAPRAPPADRSAAAARAAASGLRARRGRRPGARAGARPGTAGPSPARPPPGHRRPRGAASRPRYAARARRAARPRSACRASPGRRRASTRGHRRQRLVQRLVLLRLRIVGGLDLRRDAGALAARRRRRGCARSA